MVFNAAWVAEPMDYDFRPYAEIEGTIPEPSTRLVDQYRRKWDALMLAAKVAGPETQPDFEQGQPLTDLLDAWRKFELDDPAVQALDKAMVEATAFVCQNKPTATQINKLPSRQRAAFIGWVRSEMINPKLNSGATPLPETNTEG